MARSGRPRGGCGHRGAARPERLRGEQSGGYRNADKDQDADLHAGTADRDADPRAAYRHRHARSNADAGADSRADRHAGAAHSCSHRAAHGHEGAAHRRATAAPDFAAPDGRAA